MSNTSDFIDYLLEIKKTLSDPSNTIRDIDEIEKLIDGFSKLKPSKQRDRFINSLEKLKNIINTADLTDQINTTLKILIPFIVNAMNIYNQIFTDIINGEYNPNHKKYEYV